MQFQTIILLFIVTYMFTSTCSAAPFNVENDNNVCCEDLGVDMKPINNPDSKEYEYSDYDDAFVDIDDDITNLLHIPITEQAINDFGIHKYVITRNIKSMLMYHTDSHLINIIYKSINQSSHEINNLINENINEFNAMAENKFISNFLDFWCAFRVMQLSKYTIENFDTLTNMINNHYIFKK